MNHVQQMLATHPRSSGAITAELTECIDACYQCAQTCTACADACLGEDKVQHLVRCIRLNLDCFDSCVTTGNQLSRQTDPEWSLLRKQIEACAEACRVCAEECERHGSHHEHCRICAESCRRCEAACNRLLEAN
jgi:hypothetical protein